MPLPSSRSPFDSATVTIGIVTADYRSAYASRCISLVKRHTPPDFDLIILDNNRTRNFNQSRDDNKILRTAKTDYVVLMDDDVMVEAGWLEGMLRAIGNDTGVVAPMHRDKRGFLSFSGIYLMGDNFGTHAHLMDIPERPRETQCACGAILLIDMHKCGSVRFEEQYDKYFLDIDYSLKIWESGYKLIVTPEVTVTHLGGATMPHGSAESARLFERDAKIFAGIWIKSGRLAMIEKDVWSRFPSLKSIVNIPKKIEHLHENCEKWKFDQFKVELNDLLERIKPMELFHLQIAIGLEKHRLWCNSEGNYIRENYCKEALKQLKGTLTLYDAKYRMAKSFLTESVTLIKSNRYTLRLAIMVLDILRYAFSRYFCLPVYVRNFTDGPVFKLVDIYRTIQFWSLTPKNEDKGH